MAASEGLDGGGRRANIGITLLDGTLYLKGVEKELTVHPNLHPSPAKEWADTRTSVMHTKDQHQHQCGFGEFPGREQQVF